MSSIVNTTKLFNVYTQISNLKKWHLIANHINIYIQIIQIRPSYYTKIILEIVMQVINWSKQTKFKVSTKSNT